MMKSLAKYIELLYQEKDCASLGIVRALFGLCMILDIVGERGFSNIDEKWGNDWECHFPLIHGMQAPSLNWMILLYTLMWIGAFGIALGFNFKITCGLFVVPYWYIHILDKNYWNNHSYLYGLIATLLWSTEANKFFALDARSFVENPHSVPFWNYLILKSQIFLLYFHAGLKKSSQEWLDGYAMINLSEHWTFFPFKLFLTSEQIDFFIVHWFVFIFDLTVAFWMLLERTKFPAMIICVVFHLMNSRLFSIGMFPYVCLATMPLFFRENWPRKWFSPSQHVDCKNLTKITKKHTMVALSLGCYLFLQLFLPYSHFITKGYNSWVPGIYGYSWDMMIHSWNTILIVIKVGDNNSGKDYYIDRNAWVRTDRWVKHGDMAKQYAFCLKNNLLRSKNQISENLSIYFDVWCSLNGRFQQRIFNKNIDMLKADWHPLKPVSFMMPLIDRYNSYRYQLEKIRNNIYKSSNNTNVIFVADFPGMTFEQFIPLDFVNVSLTVMKGEVSYYNENRITSMSKGDEISIEAGKFHQIETISSYPAAYFYIFNYNGSNNPPDKSKSLNFYEAWIQVLQHVGNAIFERL